MNKEQKFPLGIFSWFGFIMPLSQRLELIKEAGFDTTSLWWEDEEGTCPIPTSKMPEMVKDAGLILENIHAPFVNLDEMWSESALTRKNLVEKHLRWLHDCAEFEIPIMVMHLTEGTKPPAPNKYGLESMATLVKAAEDLGVKIAIENTRRTDNVPFILSEIPSNNLGCCYDSSHDRLVQNRGETLLTDFGHRLLATHLADNDGSIDRHWLPGHGIVDWPKLGKLFPQDSYQGCLTLEVVADEKEKQGTPEDFLKKAYGRIAGLRKIIDESKNLSDLAG